MSKLTSFDSPTDIIVKLSEGNPGAVNALCSLIKESKSIFPYLNAFEYINELDKLGIYGTDIYVMWSDICKRDIAKMVDLLKITMRDANKALLLKDACSRQDYSGLRLLMEDDIYSRVFK